MWFDWPVPAKLSPEAQKVADAKDKWRTDEIAKVKGKRVKSIDNIDSWGDGNRTILGMTYTVTEADGAVYSVRRTGSLAANEMRMHHSEMPYCCENYERGLANSDEHYLNCLTERKLIKEAPPIPVSETQKMINTLTTQVQQLSAKLADATVQKNTEAINAQQLTNVINDLQKQLHDQQQLMVKLVRIVTAK